MVSLSRVKSTILYLFIYCTRSGIVVRATTHDPYVSCLLILHTPVRLSVALFAPKDIIPLFIDNNNRFRTSKPSTNIAAPSHRHVSPIASDASFTARCDLPHASFPWCWCVRWIPGRRSFSPQVPLAHSLIIPRAYPGHLRMCPPSQLGFGSGGGGESGVDVGDFFAGVLGFGSGGVGGSGADGDDFFAGVLGFGSGGDGESGADGDDFFAGVLGFGSGGDEDGGARRGCRIVRVFVCLVWLSLGTPPSACWWPACCCTTRSPTWRWWRACSTRAGRGRPTRWWRASTTATRRRARRRRTRRRTGTRRRCCGTSRLSVVGRRGGARLSSAARGQHGPRAGLDRCHRFALSSTHPSSSGFRSLTLQVPSRATPSSRSSSSTTTLPQV